MILYRLCVAGSFFEVLPSLQNVPELCASMKPGRCTHASGKGNKEDITRTIMPQTPGILGRVRTIRAKGIVRAMLAKGTVISQGVRRLSSTLRTIRIARLIGQIAGVRIALQVLMNIKNTKQEKPNISGKDGKRENNAKCTRVRRARRIRTHS